MNALDFLMPAGLALVGFVGWTAVAAEPTPHWLQRFGFVSWETVFDHDGDGFTTASEFEFGTDPRDATSRPYAWVGAGEQAQLEITLIPGVAYRLETSTDLRHFEPVAHDPIPPSAPLVLHFETRDLQRFFHFAVLAHPNTDGDCLLDFEELTLYGTDPARADTDGDGLDDCAEVSVYSSDPLRGSPTGRGELSGKVVLDEDLDPATLEHPGTAGWTVFVDSDFDGRFEAGEPHALSEADGSYVIRELDPGFYRVSLAPRATWVQVFPALAPAPTPDGYPDRVVEVFDSGTGPIPFPYGRYVDPLPGVRVIVPSPPPHPVDASVVLGPLPPPPIAGPFGGWAHVDILAIPTNSFVTVAFEGEEIIDGPGPDLVIWCAATAANDAAELYLGSTASNLTSAGVFAQSETIPIDLATVAVPQPVRYVKLRGLGLVGTYPGIDVVGFEALHYRPLSAGHYDVTVQGGQTVANLDFGVAGNDRPPKVLISPERTEVRAGEFLAVQVTPSDDLGIASVQLTANGVAVPLDAELRGVAPVAHGGLFTLTATVTDTAGQSGATLLTLIARHADGSLPELAGLAITGEGGSGGPSIQVFSPVAGEIVSGPRAVVGTIVGAAEGVASWQVHYAPADSVNPEALDAPDADYVLLSEGAGPVVYGNLGALAGDTLAAGAYLVRVSATDQRGTASYLGFVAGVRVDPLDLRPAILLTAPANESTVSYLTDLRGSITTRGQLREWYVEQAPLSQVNLHNLGDNTPDWTRLNSGTNPITDGLLARFDPTLLPNDSYVLRVSAWNQNGLGWTEAVVVHVTGGAKLGNFAVEFTDFELPLAGVPVTVKRVYDSLNAHRAGDFGYGWSLALQEAAIAETVPQTGTGFGSTPFRVGTRVYLTAPDGRRIGFTFQPEVGAVSFLGAAYRAVFKPDPGVLYTLGVPEGETPFLALNGAGEAALFFIPLPWNPDTYVLTDTRGTRYTYDQREGLIEVADLAGNRVTFTAEAITHNAGPRVRFTRDAAGRLTRMDAPDGRTWLYQYDAQGDLAQVTYPGGVVGTFSYAAGRPHFLETIQDPTRGPTLRTEYDDAGRVTALIDAAGHRKAQTWEPSAFGGTFTDARGNVTKLAYDARGNVVRREDPLGGVTTWEYKDTAHPDRPTAMVDARGYRTTSKFDARGNLVATDTPASYGRFAYSEGNRPTRLQYGTGGVEEFEYDARGRLLESKSQLGKLTFTYTAHGLVASILDGEGAVTRIEYDGALHLPSRILLPDGGVKQFDYNAAGRLARSTDALGSVTRFEYDSMGRLEREIDAAGAETRTTYDPAFPEKPATVTDRAGRTKQYAYDALGRLVRETDANGASTQYEYDADGNRTAVVDARGQRYEFRYDALGRLVEETDPLGKQRLHRYDLAGNRVETIDRAERKRTFVYDGHNRLSEERWLSPVDGSLVRTITYTYDRVDQLLTVSDPEAFLSFGRMYVPGGPFLSEEARYTGAPARRIALSHDAAARRDGLSVTTTSPKLEPALAVDYTRDLAGRLRILNSRDPLPPSTLRGLAFQLQLWRNARGDLTELRRFSDLNGKNRISQTFHVSSDPCGCHLERIEHVVATNQPLPSATLVFTRDPEGGLTGLQAGPDVEAYAYDPTGQLTAVTRNGTRVEDYTYDGNGNRLTSHRHASYTTGPANRLTQAGAWALTYDNEGNLLAKSNTVSGVRFNFTWDHRQRLTRVQRDDPASPTPTEITDFRYDALDRRIAVIRDGRTTWTYYDGVQPLVDFMDQETTPSVIQYSGERLDELHALWRRGEGLFWPLTDHLGTPTRLLNATGQEVAAFQYDSFGNLLSLAGTQPGAVGRFGFAGREWDPVSGLYYYRARYYDPELGRFVQEDPLGFAARDANLYRYVFNRPLDLTDPTGQVTAIEYAQLAMALARPGNLCQFAVCLNGLWSGIATSVINLVPAGKPNANCAANLVGVPTDLADVLIGGGRLGLDRAGVSHPLLDLGMDLAICALKN